MRKKKIAEENCPSLSQNHSSLLLVLGIAGYWELQFFVIQYLSVIKLLVWSVCVLKDAVKISLFLFFPLLLWWCLYCACSLGNNENQSLCAWWFLSIATDWPNLLKPCCINHTVLVEVKRCDQEKSLESWSLGDCGIKIAGSFQCWATELHPKYLIWERRGRGRNAVER